MQRVSTTPRSITSYRSFTPARALSELESLAEQLRGLRVLHVNATPVGGGVAEILHSEVPLLQSMGIDAEWWTVDGPAEFFEVTKAIHNALQGNPAGLTEEEKAIYVECQQRNATQLPQGFDVVVIHDPQPLGLLRYAGKGDARWIWRLHIDSSHPNPNVSRFVFRYLMGYDAAVFTLDDFVPANLPIEKVEIIPPAIDPLTAKNQPMPYGTSMRTLQSIGIDPRVPIVAQIARLDPWKDPWGVIDAYRLIRERHDDLQLVLLGVIEAKDDPQAYGVYHEVLAYAGGDQDIHIFVDPDLVGPREVAAVQLAAQVVFQKSLREGFGLSVSEALWKATPVVAGRAGGIPLQLEDERGGYLVDSVDEAADRALSLLNDPARARVIGARGRERVRDRFLITRMLVDELRLYASVLSAGTSQAIENLEAAG